MQVFNTLLNRMARERCSIPTVIIHYDPSLRDLGVWFWCVVQSRLLILQQYSYPRRPVTNTGGHVTPSELWDLRTTHDFKTPCCLCAFNTDGNYTECAIYRAHNGEFGGEYVASCAYGRCGYIGM